MSGWMDLFIMEIIRPMSKVAITGDDYALNDATSSVVEAVHSFIHSCCCLPFFASLAIVLHILQSYTSYCMKLQCKWVTALGGRETESH